jgi:predicted DNA binding CopG/RHH family protein
MKRKSKLDSYERGIESEIHKYVPITGTKRRRVEAILDASGKTKNINIRINEMDLSSLKRNAEEEGIPYQTLIASVLHKYLSGRLVDEKHVRKSMELLSASDRA